MKAYFELNDKGTCRRFTLVKGVQRTHTFIFDPAGGSKLQFEGSQAEFTALMRDIYGVISPNLRPKAIFVHVEMPDVSPLEARIAELEKLNGDLAADLEHANKRMPAPVTHPFPLETPVPKKKKGQPVQADVGLPVGPGAPIHVKGITKATVMPSAESKAEATKAKRKATWERKKAEAAAEAAKPKKARKQPAHA